jgi:hypothetical protein
VFFGTHPSYHRTGTCRRDGVAAALARKVAKEGQGSPGHIL